jgi:hypothetical protein
MRSVEHVKDEKYTHPHTIVVGKNVFREDDKSVLRMCTILNSKLARVADTF